jgi:cytochrome b
MPPADRLTRPAGGIGYKILLAPLNLRAFEVFWGKFEAVFAFAKKAWAQVRACLAKISSARENYAQLHNFAGISK